MYQYNCEWHPLSPSSAPVRAINDMVPIVIDHSPRKFAPENAQFRSLQTPRSSRLLTQHEDHLAAQTVVDVEGLLAIIIFLPVPGVGADYRPGHYLRHSSEEQPENSQQN